jgi:hypothetical protein
MTLNDIKALFAEHEKTGRPIQVKVSDRWMDSGLNEHLEFRLPDDCYRVAPPPKPREWWILTNSASLLEVHGTSAVPRGEYVRVREVMEENK